MSLAPKERKVAPFLELYLSKKANKSEKTRWITHEKVEMQLTSKDRAFSDANTTNEKIDSELDQFHK